MKELEALVKENKVSPFKAARELLLIFKS